MDELHSPFASVAFWSDVGGREVDKDDDHWLWFGDFVGGV